MDDKILLKYRQKGQIMKLLDDIELYSKFDKDNMLGKISELPENFEIAWTKSKKFIVPTHYIKAKNIVVLGLGGSAIGGDLAKDLIYKTSKIPVFVVRDYDLPNFVGNDTLVLASSYSGNTEETLTTFQKAIDVGAKCIAITTGGKMASMARKHKIPIFEIDYSSAPRAAIAYSFMPLICIFNKLGYIEFGKDEALDSIQNTKIYRQKINFDITTNNNEAKKLAEKIHQKIPVIFASGNLKNIARRFKDQINENAKNIAMYDEVPELCHNHIVGLDYPKDLQNYTLTILLQSKFDNPRNKIRYQVLQQILSKKGIKFENIFINQKGGELSEILHNIMFVDFVSYYLSILNQVDPSPVDIIQFLKDKLADNK